VALHTGCSRTMVDWILTFAFPFIRMISKVTLKGYVKKPVKDKWEDILTKERRKEEHDYDQDAAMAKIFATPANML
jgi:hypothetical protein